MSITLEKIKEMNLSFGTPIEMDIINTNLEQYNLLGYYQGLHKAKEMKYNVLLYDVDTLNKDNWKASIKNKILISQINNIKILDYKK